MQNLISIIAKLETSSHNDDSDCDDNECKYKSSIVQRNINNTLCPELPIGTDLLDLIKHNWIQYLPIPNVGNNYQCNTCDLCKLCKDNDLERHDYKYTIKHVYILKH